MTHRGLAFGYTAAVTAAAISGVSVFVNGLGVRTFADPLLYTCLKDGVVGIALLVPLAFAPRLRAEYRQIPGTTWLWTNVTAGIHPSKARARSTWTYHFDVVASRYLHALNGGVVPLELQKLQEQHSLESVAR